MKVSELFENFLIEDLGNLAKLKVGPMINILKQSGHVRYRRRGDNELHVGPTGSRFGGGSKTDRGNNSKFGDTSEIIDIGVLKDGFKGLRKAYKQHEDAKAFALYVDGKAVCFGVYDDYTLAGSSRAGIFAYDLSQFKERYEKEHEDKKAEIYAKHAGKNDSYWLKSDLESHERQAKKSLSSYYEKEPGSWEKREAEKKGKILKNQVFHGSAKTTGDLKVFIDELIKISDGKPITCKLVMQNSKGAEKQKARWRINMSNNDLLTGVEALKERLTKYKISKKPSVDNIEDFLKMTLSDKVSVIQFAGHGWKATPENHTDIKPLHVLNGVPFQVRYSCVDPGSYGGIYVYYKFNKETGILKPFKATWDEKPKTPTETTKARVGVLDADEYLKDELGIKKLDKDSIITAILKAMKEGNVARARNLVAAVEKHGLDYPELAAIKKSLKAEE